MKVALVCIAKNEDKYIEEWILYNKFLGFDNIFIYQNNWRLNLSSQINSDYFKDFVRAIEFDGHAKQRPAYNHFLSNFSSEFNWAAFLDVDEFIFLKKHSNIKDFIVEYERCQAIAINWVLFGDNYYSGKPISDYSLLKRFTKRQKLVCHQVKSVISLKERKRKFKMNIHHPMGLKSYDTSLNRVIGPWNYHGNDNVAQVNHYFCKTFEEFTKKVERGNADSSGRRKFNDFYSHNFNEVDDFGALEFFNKNLKSESQNIRTSFQYDNKVKWLV